MLATLTTKPYHGQWQRPGHKARCYYAHDHPPIFLVQGSKIAAQDAAVPERLAQMAGQLVPYHPLFDFDVEVLSRSIPEADMIRIRGTVRIHLDVSGAQFDTATLSWSGHPPFGCQRDGLSGLHPSYQHWGVGSRTPCFVQEDRAFSLQGTC